MCDILKCLTFVILFDNHLTEVKSDQKCYLPKWYIIGGKKFQAQTVRIYIFISLVYNLDGWSDTVQPIYWRLLTNQLIHERVNELIN